MNRLKTDIPDKEADAAAWISWCRARLGAYEADLEAYPVANPVARLAHDLFEAAREGLATEAIIADVVKALGDAALAGRAEAFAQAHRVEPVDAARIEALLAPLDAASFETVRRELERTRAGVVFTAHPTFAMSAALARAVAEYAAAPERSREAFLAAVRDIPHAPETTVTLGDEHAAAQEAIARARAVLRGFVREILLWAKARYPDQWSALTPTPISVASWVGYDLDGRTDIHWAETFRIRLDEKARQLRAYAEALAAIETRTMQDDHAALVADLAGAAALAGEQAQLFSGDLAEEAHVAEAANKLTRDDPRRLTSLEGPVARIDALCNAAGDDETRLALAVLKAEMRTYGLGAAHIHLRVNAAQVRSALRADLGVDDGRDFLDRTVLTAAAEKARTVSARRINVASIFLEKMTARRQFMLCAQFLKHVDADAPIRFLIAECEAPATVMGAVFLARLYGVDHRLDISPLFETPDAIERGGRFVERLLKEEEFRRYVKGRGRIAVQIGFSDSGRFMGQVAANLAIERLQILVARALAAENMTDIEVVVFNTHGESMGRGAFPGTLKERYDYLMTPWTRARYAREGLNVVAECSFQGGDGFLHFANDRLASASVSSLFNWSFISPAADRGDRYYADINYSWDFFRSVEDWQKELFDNPEYQEVIGAFAGNFLFATGSRKTRRQSGAVVRGPRALRAIPHNAILQQLAAPANVFGGIGAAGGADAERLVEHASGSARMRQILAVAGAARARTGRQAQRAYAAAIDPSVWISKAFREDDRRLATCCDEIARQLKGRETATSINRLGDHYASDLTRFDRLMQELAGDRAALAREEMHALHAIRQAMIMRGLLLTASVPSFSPRHDLTRAALFEMAFAIRFEDLAALLEEIFPAESLGATLFERVLEPADDVDIHARGYPEIHTRIIAPLRRLHASIREISVSLSHVYGAWG